MAVSDMVQLYVEVIQIALPFTIVFWISEMLVTTFLRAAFSGKLSFSPF